MKRAPLKLAGTTFSLMIFVSLSAHAVMPPYERIRACSTHLEAGEALLAQEDIESYLRSELTIGGKKLDASEVRALGEAFSIYDNPTLPNLIRFRSELGTIIEVFSPKNAAVTNQLLRQIHMFSRSFSNRAELLLDMKYLSQKLSPKVKLPAEPDTKLRVLAALLSFKEHSLIRGEELVHRVNQAASYAPDNWTAIDILESLNIIPPAS